MNTELHYWGELCYTTGMTLGKTPPEAPVQMEISAPAIAVPTSNNHLKELGFTKLVRRDEGVYENVTALDHEKRYVTRGQKDSMPDFKSKIHD
ncbi:MAG: zinc ribbon domain-containing protein [Candidatus Porifericomitaceae bacterium WSBS_2022_MAG_OTU9]